MTCICLTRMEESLRIFLCHKSYGNSLQELREALLWHFVGLLGVAWLQLVQSWGLSGASPFPPPLEQPKVYLSSDFALLCYYLRTFLDSSRNKKGFAQVHLLPLLHPYFDTNDTSCFKYRPHKYKCSPFDKLHLRDHECASPWTFCPTC